MQAAYQRHRALRIGDLVERYGVSAEALRVWERQGLIPPARRTPGGHRRYAEEHLAALDRLLVGPVRPEAGLRAQAVA